MEVVKVSQCLYLDIVIRYALEVSQTEYIRPRGQSLIRSVGGRVAIDRRVLNQVGA